MPNPTTENEMRGLALTLVQNRLRAGLKSGDIDLSAAHYESAKILSRLNLRELAEAERHHAAAVAEAVARKNSQQAGACV